MAGISSKPSMESDTGSRSYSYSLGLKLFLALLIVALVGILASAIIANTMANARVNRYFTRMQGPPEIVDTLNTEQLQHDVNMAFIVGGAIAVGLAGLISLYFSLKIRKPLVQLTAATRFTAFGDYSSRVEAGGTKELEELADAFNTLAGNLERDEELRKNMVADIAHELRTPLSTINGYLEAIEDGVVQPDKTTISSMREEVSVLSLIIDDLRQLAEVEAGQMRLDLAPVPVGEALEAESTRFSHEVESKGIGLSLEVHPDVPNIRADAARLSQILGNLIKNALAHTPAGETIRLSAETGEGQVLFKISDTGAGIPAEDLPLIFERFYRADRARERATGGAGLGLTIAKSLVEAQGGHIWAESAEGQGTTIFFTLPVEAPTA